MATDATTRKPLRPTPLGEARPPRPDAEAKIRAIAEAQGVVLDGKAYERILEAGKDFFDSPEEHEQFIELLRQIRKEP